MAKERAFIAKLDLLTHLLLLIFRVSQMPRAAHSSAYMHPLILAVYTPYIDSSQHPFIHLFPILNLTDNSVMFPDVYLVSDQGRR